ASTSVVLRAARLHRRPEEAITEEEVRLLISRSAEAGSFEQEEADLIDRVFHFGDRQVHEVMTPRNLAVAVERKATVADFYAIYLKRSHSRFPVYDESPDKVVGILGIKDVLAALARGEVTPSDPIEPLIRPALFTPESKPIDDLFREMQATGNQMAI